MVATEKTRGRVSRRAFLGATAGETVEVLIRFDAYRGIYLMHCHKLEHEDMGMMSNFEVV